jgi:hypothetical protein
LGLEWTGWSISIRLIFAICRRICARRYRGGKGLCQVSLQKVLGVYVVGGLAEDEGALSSRIDNEFTNVQVTFVAAALVSVVT